MSENIVENTVEYIVEYTEERAEEYTESIDANEANDVSNTNGINESNEASSVSAEESWMQKVQKIAEDICQREGCYLYDMQMLGLGKGRTLQVFIDKDGGVGIEDCSNVSKGLNLLLDVEDIVPGGAYNLEVSTPGLDRRLNKSWHFEKVVGKKIWVRTKSAFESFGMTDKRWKATKQIEAELTSVDNSGICFELKEGTLKIPFDGIEKAHLVFEMKKNSMPKKSK